MAALAAGLVRWLGLSIMSGVAIFGIPIGALVGFAMAPRVLESKAPWLPTILSAVVAILVAIGGMIAWSLVEMTSNRSAIGCLLVMSYVVFFAFLIGMPITLPVGPVSAVLVGASPGGSGALVDRTRVGILPIVPLGWNYWASGQAGTSCPRRQSRAAPVAPAP